MTDHAQQAADADQQGSRRCRGLWGLRWIGCGTQRWHITFGVVLWAMSSATLGGASRADEVVVESVAKPNPEASSAFDSHANRFESVLIEDGGSQEAYVELPNDEATAHEHGRVTDGDGISWDGSEMAPPIVIEDAMPEALASDAPSFSDAGPVSVATDGWWASCAGFVSSEFLGGRGANASDYMDCMDCGHAAGHCGGGCGAGCRGGCRPGAKWAIQADALVLWRGDFASQTFLVDDIGVPALDASNVRTPAAAGPRIGILRSLGCGRAIEGNYFNVGGIEGQTSTTGLGTPYTAVGLADLPFNDIQSGQYITRGQIKSAEVNYRWGQGSRIVWLTGFRWIEWNETGSVDYEFFNPLPFGNGNVQAQVGNDLYGGQFGGQFWFLDWGKWQMNAIGKAGAYGNTAYQQTTVTGGVPPQPTLRADDQDISFFGEVGLNSTVWLTPWLAWRAGYSFFWLEGVATAAEQLPLGSFGTGTTAISTNGSVFLQGFSTGLEARW